METVRVYEIPACKMVSSRCGMFGEGMLEKFSAWFSGFPRTMFPRDFLWYDEERGGFVWYYLYEEGMAVPEDFSIVDFPGGLYAVATDMDGKEDADALTVIHDFIGAKDCFVEDHSRVCLGNITTPPAAAKAMGYEQMDYYVPIRIIE